MNCHRAVIFAVAWLGLGFITKAQVTYTGMDDADAFLATGSSNNPAGTDLTGLNFGGAGTLVVASAASGKGEFQSVLKFNLANAVALFNANYGVGHWIITSLSLTLTSNYGTGGVQPNNAVFPMISSGHFVIEWLSNDDWVEGTGTPNLPTTDGVTYDSLPVLLSGEHEILGTNFYSPPGNNMPVTYPLPLTTNLLANVSAGGDVTFLFYAADDQIGYLFNSYSYGRGNQPLINVTATANAAPLKNLSGIFTKGVFHLTGAGNNKCDLSNPSLHQSGDDQLADDWHGHRRTATATFFIDDLNATNAQRFYRFSQ